MLSTNYELLLKELTVSENPSEVLVKMMPEWFEALHSSIEFKGKDERESLIERQKLDRFYANLIQGFAIQYLSWILEENVAMSGAMRALLQEFSLADMFRNGISREEILKRMGKTETSKIITPSTKIITP
jgi:hypothetical protein